MIWLGGLLLWIGFGVLFVHRVGQAIGRGEDGAASDSPPAGVMRIPFANGVQ